VREEQREQSGLLAVLLTEPSLQLGAAEQELLTAWKIVQGACSILLLSASPLGSVVLAAHVEEVCTRDNKKVIPDFKRKMMRAAYLVVVSAHSVIDGPSTVIEWAKYSY
jgi:hypothetical protein